MASSRVADSARRFHIACRRELATWRRSLSPRPQRFTTIRWSFGFFGASSITLASACAGSSAGMMPSSLRAELEGGQRLLVGRREIGHAADVVQPGMLRADAGIVEAGRDRMGLRDLAVVVHQQIGAVAVQHAGPAAGRARRRAGRSEGRGRPPRRRRSRRRDRRGRGGTGRWRWSRRRCRRSANPAGGLRPPCICSRVSLPITHWKSRTIAG